MNNSNINNIISNNNRKDSSTPPSASNSNREGSSKHLDNNELMKHLTNFNHTKYVTQHINKGESIDEAPKNKENTSVVSTSGSSGHRQDTTAFTPKATDFCATQLVWWNVDKAEFQLRYQGTLPSDKIDRILHRKGRILHVLPKRRVGVSFKDIDGEESFELTADSLRPADPPFKDKHGHEMPVGSVVRLCPDRVEAAQRQQGFGGFNESMAQCCGKVGYVQGCNRTSVRVLSGVLSFLWNPQLVERVDAQQLDAWRHTQEDNVFHACDLIAFKYDDLALLEAAQDGHGGWNDKMNQFVNKIGYVRKVFDVTFRGGDLKVFFGCGRPFRLNRDLCCVVVPSNQQAASVNSARLQNDIQNIQDEPPESRQQRRKPTDLLKAQRVLWNIDRDAFRNRYLGHLEDWELEKLLVSPGRIVGYGPTRDKVNAKFDSLDNVFVIPQRFLVPMEPPFKDKNGCHLQIGTLVRLCVNVAEAKRLQEGFGGFTKSMEQCCGKIGYVQGCTASQVRVLSGVKSCMWNPFLVECIGQQELDAFQTLNKENTNFRKHDVVAFKIPDSALITLAQEGHGGWDQNLEPLLFRMGYVRKVYDSGDLKVYFGGKSLPLNPDLCSIIVTADHAVQFAGEEPAEAPKHSEVPRVLADLGQERFKKVDFLLHETVVWNVTLDEFHTNYSGSMSDEKVLRLLKAEGTIEDIMTTIGKVVVKFEGFPDTFTVSKPTVRPKDPYSFSNLHLGDLVRIESDEARIITLQNETCGFLPGMLKCGGKIGYVRGSSSGNVVVLSGNVLWAWNVQLLTKLNEAELEERKVAHRGSKLNPGDFVQLVIDEMELEQLPEVQGGWKGKMCIACVLFLDWNGDPTVQIHTHVSAFNKEACTKLVDVSECGPYIPRDNDGPAEAPRPVQNQEQKPTELIKGQSVAWNVSREEFLRQFTGSLGGANVDTVLHAEGRILLVESKNRLHVRFGSMDGAFVISRNYLRVLDPPFTDSTGQKLFVGSLVILGEDPGQTPGSGRFTEAMRAACGKVAFVQGYCGRLVRVLCGGRTFLWNPVLLERVDDTTLIVWRGEHSNRTIIQPHDVIAFKYDDLALLEVAQDGHGGWNDLMSQVVFDFGYVVKVHPSGDLKVFFGERSFHLNPDICCVVVPANYTSPDFPRPSETPMEHVTAQTQSQESCTENSELQPMQKWVLEVKGIEIRLGALLGQLNSIQLEEKGLYSRSGATGSDAGTVEEVQGRHVDVQNEIGRILHALTVLILELDTARKLIPGQEATTDSWQMQILQDPVLNETFQKLRALVVEERKKQQVPRKNMLQHVMGSNSSQIIARNRAAIEEYDKINEQQIIAINNILSLAFIPLANCVTIDEGAVTQSQPSSVAYININNNPQEELSRLITELSTRALLSDRKRRVLRNPTHKASADAAEMSSLSPVRGIAGRPSIEYSISTRLGTMIVAIVDSKCHMMFVNNMRCAGGGNILLHFLGVALEV